MLSMLSEHESSNLLVIEVNTDQHGGWILLSIGLSGIPAIFLVIGKAVLVHLLALTTEVTENKFRTQVSIEMTA